ncbi:MAG: DNA internalization-related competence protein ComEC/Rec2 [Candidatus Eremiobacteraeota bacterium]|nr:DNA internalization-related competence protein ComEC/Rec2 [Candidatus Eremiobacteraeota bacterium]
MKRAALARVACVVVFGTALVQPIDLWTRTLLVFGLILTFGPSLRRSEEEIGIRAALAVALVAALLSARMHQLFTPTFYETRTEQYTGTIIGDLQTSGNGSTFGMQLDDGRRVLVSAMGALPQLGARLRLRGRLEPFDEARNPGEPSERAIEQERGYQAHLSSARILARLAAAKWSLNTTIASLHRIIGAGLRSQLPEPEASILAGELWGERAALPPDLKAEFQQTGTVHVLVTAGLHLGIVALLTFWLLSALRIHRTTTCVLTAAIVWVYAIFSGAHLPAMRAATMVSFALAARAIGAKAISLNAISAAAIFIVFLQPESAISASFALSFSCVGSILVSHDVIDHALGGLGDYPKRLREALSLTIATQIGTWPIIAATFLAFMPYAVIANVAVVPVVGVTMLLGFVQVLLSPVPALAQAIANLNLWLLTWMVDVVHVIAALPAARIVMTPAPLWAIGVYDVAVITAFWCFRRAQPTAACGLLIFSIALILNPPQLNAHHRLIVTVLDVGQADGIVIQTPAGHTLLVDAGGRLERGPLSAAQSSAEQIGERIVVPFLLRHGVHHVDAILLSHPHGDHAGGVAPVLRELGTNEFADSGQVYRGFAYQDALSVARSERVRVVYPRAGMVWRTNDGVSLRFFGPELPFITGSRNDINSNSLVFMLQYKSFRMLFTGDAGAEAEQRILSEGVDLHATVLKVGHHGSAYSSTPEFIAAIRPKYAVISVGRHNLFGHPAPSTIETLQRIGAAVYRTDENGAVRVVTDGAQISIHTVLKEALPDGIR